MVLLPASGHKLLWNDWQRQCVHRLV